MVVTAVGRIARGLGCGKVFKTNQRRIQVLTLLLAGFFAAGEIGPIAGRNALHGFTASMVLFIDEMN